MTEWNMILLSKSWKRFGFYACFPLLCFLIETPTRRADYLNLRPAIGSPVTWSTYLIQMQTLFWTYIPGCGSKQDCWWQAWVAFLKFSQKQALESQDPCRTTIFTFLCSVTLRSLQGVQYVSLDYVTVLICKYQEEGNRLLLLHRLSICFILVMALKWNRSVFSECLNEIIALQSSFSTLMSYSGSSISAGKHQQTF